VKFDRQKLVTTSAKRAGLESPDFAMGTESDSPKTTSLMTPRLQQAVPMIIAWEALVTVTKGFVEKTYWKIS
jgi:hypothetical protein